MKAKHTFGKFKSQKPIQFVNHRGEIYNPFEELYSPNKFDNYSIITDSKGGQEYEDGDEYNHFYGTITPRQ